MKPQEKKQGERSSMFKDKIKKLRETHNLTQEELAKKVMVSRTAVSKWETGKGYPSLDTLKEISLLFDISIDECKCQYKNDQKVENKNVHLPRAIPQPVLP